MNSIDLKSFNQIISKGKALMNPYFESNQNYDKVLLVGNTGSGKSTIGCILADDKVMIRLNKKRVQLECKGIKSGAKSVTKTPNIRINEEYHLLIADCPGFGDTEGTRQEIIHSFYIDYLIDACSNNYNRLKIFLVISKDEIYANRAKYAFENFGRIEKMFPDKEQLEKAVGVIFTKAEPNYSGIDYIDDLNEEPPANGAKWIEFFSNNPDKVFSLPMADKNKVDTEYEYEEKNIFLEFLQKDQIENPVHQVAFSKEANDELKNCKSEIFKQFNEKIENLFSSMYEIYSKVEKLIQLKDWTDFFNKLSMTDNITVTEFSNTFKKNFPHENLLSDCIDDLLELETVDSFICKVLGEKSTIHQIISRKTKISIKRLEPIKKLVQDNENNLQRAKEQEERNNELFKQITTSNERHDARISELMKQMATDSARANETISQLQSKVDNQNTEIREMLQKLEYLNKYEKIYKKASRIEKGFYWKRVNCGNHLDEPDLHGILKYLISESHGDIIENGIIKIISSDTSDCLSPKNCVKFDSDYWYSPSGNDYIIFDFKDRKINVDHYLLASSNDLFLKNWKLEGSNDCSTWKNIDNNSNENTALCYENIRCIFKTYSGSDDIFRYIKFISTGPTFIIRFIEFYGTLYEPK